MPLSGAFQFILSGFFSVPLWYLSFVRLCFCCSPPPPPRQLEKTVAATEELAAANKKIVALQQELRETKRSLGGEAQVLLLLFAALS